MFLVYHKLTNLSTRLKQTIWQATTMPSPTLLWLVQIHTQSASATALTNRDDRVLVTDRTLTFWRVETSAGSAKALTPLPEMDSPKPSYGDTRISIWAVSHKPESQRRNVDSLSACQDSSVKAISGTRSNTWTI